MAAATGTHAQDYFQQRVDFTITVRLDDEAHMLHGQESFMYTNNSPVTLDTLWLHLWPNAYRDRHSALCQQLDRSNDFDLHFAEPADRGWIDSLNFRAGLSSTPLSWGPHPRHGDIAWLKLPAPLAPGTSITISTPFRVKVPDGRFSRLGHTGQAYYITQWYPKPAVFDRDGWHAMPYLTQGEFYSEFGSFDVSITLPANYIVGATGVLQNAEESAFMHAEAAKPLPDGPTKDKNEHPPSTSELKTVRFTQDSIHDFAWFADKRFVVRKSEVKLERSGRTVTTWALFTPRNARVWADAVSYVNESVKLYSRWVGDYPYSACTAVDGTISAGGGMEYPMITIIGNTGSEQQLDNVIAHEVGHNWFYGILASNERDHPWMDEGMNSFVELRYMRLRHPDEKPGMGFPGTEKLFAHVTDGHRLQNELAYRLNARRNLDQPIEGPSEGFTSINYGTTVYMKTALVFDQLLAYLGEETFDRCMHAYYTEWQFKHPRPEDLRRVFERESGKPLGWLFDQFIASDRKVEVSTTHLKAGRLHFRTNSTAPFPITGWKGDSLLGTTWSEHATVGWKLHDPIPRGTYEERVADQEQHRLKGKGSLALPWPEADRVRIDAEERTLDIDRRDNTARDHGLFRRSARMRVRLFTGLEAEDAHTTYWLPGLAYNAHDGFMAGLVLHNHHFPSQRFEYVLAPLYGFSSERLSGGARGEYHFDRIRSDWFRNIHLGASLMGFSLKGDEFTENHYRKLTPSVRFDLRRDLGHRDTDHRLSLRSILISETSDVMSTDGSTSSSVKDYTYFELRHDLMRRTGLYPFQANLTFLGGDIFTRVSAEVNWSALYDARKHRVSLRFFGGQFFSTRPELMESRMGWRYHWGSSDLLYDNLFFERQNVGTLTGQQFDKVQGGFKTPNSYGTSDTWMAAANLEVDLPLALPLALFGSAGAAPVKSMNSSGTFTTSTAFQWEAGLGLRIVRDVVEVWLPLFYSKDINDQLNLKGIEGLERVRFVFAIERMDPTRALRNLQP
ncbi:MAG: M1 family metallopeptidase [Flavobacteriales bacterium]|nr:M1 family metallopeptidase [Flavobacteriales bacterium]